METLNEKSELDGTRGPAVPPWCHQLGYGWWHLGRHADCPCVGTVSWVSLADLREHWPKVIVWAILVFCLWQSWHTSSSQILSAGGEGWGCCGRCSWLCDVLHGVGELCEWGFNKPAEKACASLCVNVCVKLTCPVAVYGSQMLQ